MRFKAQAFCLLIFVHAACFAQTITKYGVSVVDDTTFYHNEVEHDSLNQLVNLEKYIPGIKLDLRYATNNNFVGVAVYPPNAKAYLRLPAAIALKKVKEELAKKGLGLKILDAYRPYSVTIKFWEKVKDSNYVASPYHGSRHNRGCAVDLTLIDNKTGHELEMPTGFDDFSVKAHSDYKLLSKTAIANRTQLISVMAKYGFRNLPEEWWHFDFSGWENYFLMDISFDDLD